MKIAKSIMPALLLGALALPAFSGAAHAAPVKWQPTLDAAMKQAKRTGKPIFIDFYATWCGPCKLLDKSYATKTMQTAASRYIMVKVDVDKNQPIAQKYGADSLPTMLFLSSKGKVLGRKVGFMLPQGIRTEKEAVAHIAKDVANSMTVMRQSANKVRA